MSSLGAIDFGGPILGNTDVARAPVRGIRRRVVWGIGIVGLLVSLVLITSTFRAAVPKVDAGGLFIDTVQRGEMVRSVQGAGQLVPEDIRWVTASTTAHVEHIRVRPGVTVEADTVLMDLSNPDTELQLLEAQRQLAAARADLANLEATAQNQRLAQEGVIVGLRADAADARRREEADVQLTKRGFLSELDMAQSRDRAQALANRLSFEEKRLLALGHGTDAQEAAQRAQVLRLGSLVEFRRAELDRLHVRAGMAGVLQELVPEAGQSVTPGAVLAKVARPDRLKAEVHIPEVEAKDLALGQKATVDLRTAVVQGRVTHIDPTVQAGAVRVDVSLEGPLPQGAKPDLNVEATIELERLPDVLYLGRPAGAQPGKDALLFKLVAAGDEARRTPVRLGRMSARFVEVLSGLSPGDHVVLSETSQWDLWDHVRIR
jgi:multidrug efflux pump subunit AcrA (membrane-fusion protein)